MSVFTAEKSFYLQASVTHNCDMHIVLVRCSPRLLGSAAWCCVTFRELNNENVDREHVQIQLAGSKGS
jgi:hypothetical protein